MKNGKKLFLITSFILMGIFSLTVFAQDKKDDISAKMKKLDGKVEKITVKVDGKDVVFEGKEAESLVKKMKMMSHSGNMVWISKDGDESKPDHADVSVFEFKGKDDADLKHAKKVEIRIEDDNKKVTVTTEKDGKEETKVYEGEEAEKYLKEHEGGGKMKFFIKDGDDEDGDVFMFRHGENDEDCGSCCCGKKMKHMKMRMPMHGSGAKKIIIEKEKHSTDKDSDSK